MSKEKINFSNSIKTELEFGTHPRNTAPKTKIAAAYLEVLKADGASLTVEKVKSS